MEHNHEPLIKILDSFEVPYDEYQLEQLDYYYTLLIEKNKECNLTAITDYDEVLVKHFGDSLSLLKYLPLNREDFVNANSSDGELKLLDLGTGAGFPGIPLKIFCPDVSMVLFDKVGKKADFAADVCEELGLNQVSVCKARAEDLAQDLEYREQFDYVVSRAVSNLSVLSEYCLAFLRKGGTFISYKGADIATEAEMAEKAIKTLGGRLEKIEEFKLPTTDIKRSFVFIKKIANTPGRYPRKAGIPEKKPIE